MMDLSSLDVKQSWMVLVDPSTGQPDPDGAGILFVGPESWEYRRGLRFIARQFQSIDKSSDEYIEASMMADIDLICGCAKSWRGITSGGKEAEFSISALRDMLIKCPAIADQAASFLLEKENFTNGCLTNVDPFLSGISGLTDLTQDQQAADTTV